MKKILLFSLLSQPHPNPTHPHKNLLARIDDALKSTSSLARGSFNKF